MKHHVDTSIDQIIQMRLVILLQITHFPKICFLLRIKFPMEKMSKNGKSPWFSWTPSSRTIWTFLNWHEPWDYSWSLFRRSIDNAVSAPLFSPFFSIPFHRSPSQLFLKERLLGWKQNYGGKVDRSAQKSSRPRLPFWGPLAAILDFAGGAALQAVSERPLCR